MQSETKNYDSLVEIQTLNKQIVGPVLVAERMLLLINIRGSFMTIVVDDDKRTGGGQLESWGVFTHRCWKEKNRKSKEVGRTGKCVQACRCRRTLREQTPGPGLLQSAPR